MFELHLFIGKEVIGSGYWKIVVTEGKCDGGGCEIGWARTRGRKVGFQAPLGAPERICRNHHFLCWRMEDTLPENNIIVLKWTKNISGRRRSQNDRSTGTVVKKV